MPRAASTIERVRAAEVIAALSLATDLGTAVRLEHGLHSTLVAMRLADRLGVDAQTVAETYYACLLFYVGCTANADVAAEIFGRDDALTAYATARRFGSRSEMLAGLLRAVAPPGGSAVVRARQLAHGLPRLPKVFQDHLAAFCQVATMLTGQLGLPPSVGALFDHVAERWDGKGWPGRAKGDAVPLPVRIVHVARDAAFQFMVGGQELAARVVHQRAGRAFDPAVAGPLVDQPAQMLATGITPTLWDEALAREPRPWLILHGDAIDEALAAMGDFSDLVSPYLAGHAAGVAGLATAAARLRQFPADDVATVRRAALVHDLGRVAVPARVWQQPGPLTADDWEKVRLHPYHTERVLARSPFLAALSPVAGGHHERCDGSGYHRGTSGAGLTPPARVLAAADAYRTKTEPRPHRERLDPEQAAQWLGRQANEGRLDADSVTAVLAAAGRPAPRVARPAGLTSREAEVIGLLARGLQTKQIARELGISIKTADRHVQKAYSKIGVSTRAAATLFAMRHGIVAWGELPISSAGDRS